MVRYPAGHLASTCPVQAPASACPMQAPILAFMRPYAPPAQLPTIAVAVTQHRWEGDTVGKHLSMSATGITCPCPELAGRGHSVLSFAVAGGDAATFLRGQMVHARAIDWFEAAQGPRRTEIGRHAVGGRGPALYKDTVWTSPATSSTWLTLTQTLTLALTLALTLTRCGAKRAPPPRGSRRGPRYRCAQVP